VPFAEAQVCREKMHRGSLSDLQLTDASTCANDLSVSTFVQRRQFPELLGATGANTPGFRLCGAFIPMVQATESRMRKDATAIR